MKKLVIRRWDLQLFADGGDGGASSGGESGVTAPDAEVQSGVTVPDAEVQSDVNAPDVGVQQHETEKKVDKKVAFEKLVGPDGEYKAEFEKALNTIVRGRLGEARKLAERYSSFEPIVEALAKQHGVDPNNTEALVAAINGDQESVRRRALESDMSEDAIKMMDRLEQENAQLKAKEKAGELERRYNVLTAQEQEAKKAYPSFNFENEMENETFSRLVRAGVPMKAAYETAHMRELVTGAIAHAVQTTEKRVADTVAAGAKRPAENGMSASVSASAKVDLASISPKQRAAYNDHIKRGGKLGIAEFLSQV